MDSFDDFLHDPHTVFKASTVFIRSYIAVGTDELMEQIPVSAMDFYSISVCLLRIHCAIDKLFDHFMNLIDRHFVGYHAVCGVYYSAGRNHLSAAGELWLTFTAWMKQLEKDLAVIFNMFLAGMTAEGISNVLKAEKIKVPGKELNFSKKMILGILQNEKYCGDCILQKTVTVDCISKTRKKNEGEAPMYLVENSHPAIVSREVFNRVQEEISRRKALPPQSKKKAVTASGKYSKYALTEVLKCGECGSRYKRVTWTSRGKKQIVWRCVSRLDHGKKYCKDSITVKEGELQEAIVRAIRKFNEEDDSTYIALMKATLGDALGITGNNEEIEFLERRIEALNKRMVQIVSASVQAGESVEHHEDEFRRIAEEIDQLKRRIDAAHEKRKENPGEQERLKEIQATIDSRSASINVYDDTIVRQMIECIRVYHDGRLEIIFGGGYEIAEHL